MAVDVDGVADLGPAVQGGGLPGGDVVGVQDGAELGGHGRVVVELGDEFHLVLDAVAGSVTFSRVWVCSEFWWASSTVKPAAS